MFSKILFSLLHNYDVKGLNFKLTWKQERQEDILNSTISVWRFGRVPLSSAPIKFSFFLITVGIETIAKKFEGMENPFFCNVFISVTVGGS